LITIVSYPMKRHLLFDSATQREFTGTLAGNILHVWDVIDDATIKTIIDKFGEPKYIVMDSFSYYNTSLDVPVYCIDAWIEYQLTQFKSIVVTPVDGITMDHVANFLINKKQINRFLAMKLSEIFDIDVNYTWSGVGKEFDLMHIIQEKNSLNDSLIDQYWGEILSPISKFKEKWYSDSDNTVVDSFGIAEYGNNVETWNKYLNHIVSNSAISIITESVWTQHATTFTEKTLYSVLGMTFPIWVGGVNSATCWKNKGFDIFDDVIDHSYQNLPTLLERCFYAFYLNKDILTDFEKVSTLRKQKLGRLINNRNLLTSGTFKKYNQAVVQQWPKDLQELANTSIIKHLPGLDSYLRNESC
jgi:hypothetical protein